VIPYVPAPFLQLGPMRLPAFGILLAVAILWARWLILGRAQRKGIPRDAMWRMCVLMLVAGLTGAHLVKSILPDVDRFLAFPWLALRSGGIASLGGLGGGLLGGIMYSKLRGASVRETLAKLDVIAFALPSAWMFGRLGCALVHDHRGLFTTSWIAVQFPERPRYDLGLIEFLFLIGLASFFFALDRRWIRAGDQYCGQLHFRHQPGIGNGDYNQDSRHSARSDGRAVRLRH
jgi:phosphatidylglycerol---prolipoprotein diacylglyceryl transferase